MVKLNKPIRQPRSKDDVMQEVEQRTPHLLDHMFMDRDWIWYTGPNLTGEANKPTREALKEIGFRFSMGGHLMPDGKTRGHWGHSCTKPMGPRRRPAATPKPSPKNRTQPEDPAEMFRALGL